MAQHTITERETSHQYQCAVGAVSSEQELSAMPQHTAERLCLSGGVLI